MAGRQSSKCETRIWKRSTLLCTVSENEYGTPWLRVISFCPFEALQYAFRDRKNKKRALRSLWIARINAGARELGVSYSVLIKSLSNKDIILDRKILSDIAINDSEVFEKIVKTATS